MALVAGVDSSTQACKVVIRDTDSGELVRTGRAAHPDGTECPPQKWWDALQLAFADAGGLADVTAISVGAQQHGMVCLNEEGEVVRPALLWNDMRSAQAATDLITELGGPDEWALAVGSVPVASFTATKLRWLASHEPHHAASTAAVCLPHDWLTWKLSGMSSLDSLATDRSDASGTGYWSPGSGQYRHDLLRMALGHDALLPRVLGPQESAGATAEGILLGAGAGDNAGAALGLNAEPGDVIVSIGTSGTVFSVATVPAADGTGIVAGFADATGYFLPLVCTLNAARVLDATARMLGVSVQALSDLALQAPSGADGLVMVPYLEGERTPNEPLATGAVHGLTLANSTPAHLARAAVEGMLCALADGLDALIEQGTEARRIILIGGAAKSVAVQQIAPLILGRPVAVPPDGEYVAEGAARQAAWALTGSRPPWTMEGIRHFDGEPQPSIRERYAQARSLFVSKLDD